MGVCRGRISEGLDFSDNAARCVIVVGIPYPQMTDPKVILKKEYLDSRARLIQQQISRGQRPTLSILQGKDWYGQQATRSVNQAIGRVIRHVQDYGAILLFDNRYLYSSNRNQISGWLRNNIKVPEKYDNADLQMRAFYQKMKTKGFKSKVEKLEQLKIELDDTGNSENTVGLTNQTN